MCVDKYFLVFLLITNQMCDLIVKIFINTDIFKTTNKKSLTESLHYNSEKNEIW